jgi:hypothetical protein
MQKPRQVAYRRSVKLASRARVQRRKLLDKERTWRCLTLIIAQTFVGLQQEDWKRSVKAKVTKDGQQAGAGDVFMQDQEQGGTTAMEGSPMSTNNAPGVDENTLVNLTGPHGEARHEK